MKTNDIKKDTIVHLRSGFTARMLDNMRGNTRRVQVLEQPGAITGDMGSVYSHDIISVLVNDVFIPVEHTTAQMKLRKQLQKVFING